MTKLFVAALVGLALFLAVSGKPFDDNEPIAAPAAKDPQQPPTPDANSTPEEDEKEEDTQPEEEEAEEEDTKKAGVVQGPRNSAERVAENKAEQSRSLFEGDIRLSKKQETALKEAMKSDKKETITGFSTRGIGKKWANARVPYEIHRSFGESRRNNLDAAIAEFNKKTCVRFVPKTRSDRTWARFQVGNSGCNSYIGNMFWRAQPINIGRGCNFVGTMIHEMMHCIGFFHEQSRIDRDDHVEIIKDNYDTDYYGADYFKTNFGKYRAGEGDSLGEAYDFDSLMHYSNTAFGRKDSRGNEMVTIRAKSNPSRKLGQRNGFSESDLKQINMLYNCKKFL